MQYAMLIGPFEDNIQMDQSASLKTWVSIAAAILLRAEAVPVLETPEERNCYVWEADTNRILAIILPICIT